MENEQNITKATKKKILYVITQPEMGGAQRYARDLMTNREALDFDVALAVGRGGERSLFDGLPKNITIHKLNYLVREISPINDILAIFELKKLYQQIKPNIIHLNSSKASIIGSLAFALAKKNSKFKIQNSKLIYTAHGWVFNEPMSRLKKIFYLRAERFTAKFKDKIICVSEFDRQVAIIHKIGLHPHPNPLPGGEGELTDKLITIHNGIEPNFNFLDKKTARQELFKNYTPTPPIPPSGMGGKTIVIGTIANFYKTKGLEYLFDAANTLISSQNLPIIVAVIGEGRLRPYLENLIANYGLKEKIILLGKYEDAASYLKAFDIYVCSSVKEGFPYSILEAMTAGRPIISTDVGGIPEMIRHQKNGLLVPPKNPSKLAAQIKYLIDNPELAENLGRQASIDVTNEFSKEEMTRETFAQYK